MSLSAAAASCSNRRLSWLRGLGRGPSDRLPDLRIGPLHRGRLLPEFPLADLDRLVEDCLRIGAFHTVLTGPLTSVV